MQVDSADGTAWERGRFDDRKRGQKRILFGRMYEDPTIEGQAFPAGARVLCIASAGCTARHLAASHEVVAVDINPVQLAYARRRLAGEPVEIGTAEHVMAAFRKLLPVAGLGRAELRAFLDLDELEPQIEAWRRLCTRRFRLGLDALLSMTGLRVVYASPFLQMLPPRFGRVLLGRLERGFARHPNRGNPYARALFLGDAGPDEARAATGRIELVCADVAEHLEAQPEGSFGGFTLSNILDGASEGYRARLFAAVRRASTPDGIVVLRSFAEPGAGLHDDAAATDRSMLWGVVQIRRARELA